MNSLSQRELVEFIFHTCKVTEMGELELGELDRLVRGLHLSNDVFWPMFSEQLKEIARAHENGELLITLEYFVGMHHKFPMILYPALHMQVSRRDAECAGGLQTRKAGRQGALVVLTHLPARVLRFTVKALSR